MIIRGRPASYQTLELFPFNLIKYIFRSLQISITHGMAFIQRQIIASDNKLFYLLKRCCLHDLPHVGPLSIFEYAVKSRVTTYHCVDLPREQQ